MPTPLAQMLSGIRVTYRSEKPASNPTGGLPEQNKLMDSDTSTKKNMRKKNDEIVL